MFAYPHDSAARLFDTVLQSDDVSGLQRQLNSLEPSTAGTDINCPDHHVERFARAVHPVEAYRQYRLNTFAESAHAEPPAIPLVTSAAKGKVLSAEEFFVVRGGRKAAPGGAALAVSNLKLRVRASSAPRFLRRCLWWRCACRRQAWNS